MSEPSQQHAVAPIGRRVDAVESVLADQGLRPAEFVVEATKTAEERWVPENGARVVAKAWTDPEFRRRLLANGKSAVAELGYELPRHHRHLVVLEDTPTVHNVICCTLCSCTAFTIIGLPPEVEIRVWDTTADTRYIVLPLRPPGTEGWSEERLASIVTRDSMIGVARLSAGAA